MVNPLRGSPSIEQTFYFRQRGRRFAPAVRRPSIRGVGRGILPSMRPSSRDIIGAVILVIVLLVLLVLSVAAALPPAK